MEEAVITIMQLNCNGLGPRRVELEDRLSVIKPHIVLLQETRLRPEDNLSIPGYNVAARQDTPNLQPAPPADPNGTAPGGSPTASCPRRPASLTRVGLQKKRASEPRQLVHRMQGKEEVDEPNAASDPTSSPDTSSSGKPDPHGTSAH